MSKTKRGAWIKPVGTGGDPFEDAWLPDHLDLLVEVGFAQRPAAIKGGDHLFYYAPGPRETHQKLIAVAICKQEGAELQETATGRWPYRMPVQVRFAIPLLRFAPSYAITGAEPGEMMKADKVELNEAQYDLAIAEMTKPLTLQR